MTFLDRTEYIQRLQTAQQRPETQFLVLYGRRRIGKSTLLKHILALEQRDVYFLSDQTSDVHQRTLLAKAVAERIEGFDKVIYPDWETLFVALNRQLTSRLVLCLDEFPYMVKSCPSLPSVLQKLLNSKQLRFDLIICGSSQQLMQGYVLNKREPLYGLANEIIKPAPIPACYLQQALQCSAIDAVEEFAIWGRYSALLGVAVRLYRPADCRPPTAVVSAGYSARRAVATAARRYARYGTDLYAAFHYSRGCQPYLGDSLPRRQRGKCLVRTADQSARLGVHTAGDTFWRE